MPKHLISFSHETRHLGTSEELQVKHCTAMLNVMKNEHISFYLKLEPEV